MKNRLRKSQKKVLEILIEGDIIIGSPKISSEKEYSFLKRQEHIHPRTIKSLEDRGLIYDYSDESNYSSFYTINIDAYQLYVKSKKTPSKKEYSTI